MPAVGPHEALLDRSADHLRAVLDLAPSTVSNSRHDVACFLDWWRREHPGADLAEVRARHLADHLVAERARGLKPATIYAESSGLRSFFAWLVAEEELAADPSATLSPPRRSPTSRSTPRRDGRGARPHSHPHRPAGPPAPRHHRHAAVNGVPAGEISGLRRERPELAERRLEVRPQLPDTPYLFVNTHPFVPDPDKRCSVSALQRECRLAAQGAGLPGRHYPHRWRHSSPPS